MFTSKIKKLINLKDLDSKLIEITDEDKIDYHQTILNIGYDWWKSAPNPNAVSYSDMIDYVDKNYGQIFGTLILIGKLNQQVNNCGFLQYYNNQYSRKTVNDYGQSLHVRLVKSMIEFIDELKEEENLIDADGFFILNDALGIFKEYLKIPIDEDKMVMEEVEYGNERDGFYFEMEEVENDDYGTICNISKLDALDTRYYQLDEKFMEIIGNISKLCFIQNHEFEPLTNEETNNLLLNAVDEMEADPEEWDDEITISDRIDAMVDPEMNIFKVREMFHEAYDLGNTKSESEYLIEQFVKNFDNEYLIIKKG